MRRIFAALVFGVLVQGYGLLCAAAEGGAAAPDARTNAYLYSDKTIKILRDLGLEADTRLGLHLNCLSDYTIEKKDMTIIVLKTIVVPEGSEIPSEGAWVVRYPLTRCGETKYYNMSHVVQPDGRLKVGPFVPGTSLANPVLIMDALPMATVKAVITSGQDGCTNIHAFDTIVTEPPHDVGEGKTLVRGVWKEKWVFLVCGEKVNVPMTFIPDANGAGTSFVVEDLKN